MALSGNKGEWSEIYTLFKLLGEGKLHAGDAALNKLNLYFPILKVIRDEAKRYEYCPVADQHIVVINEAGEEWLRVPMERFVQASKSLLDSILSASTSSFQVPQAEHFMREIGCSALKASSGKKADIRIVVHDLRTNMTPELGFSIKSQLGSPSTLFNPGVPTNFLYKVTGTALSDSQIEALNNVPGHVSRMEAFDRAGGKLVFHDVEHAVFKNNLLFLDCCMPRFMAACLLEFNLPNPASKIADVVERVAKRNPFGFTGKHVLTFYEHKMKVFLTDAALGMTAAKEWLGRYEANGGYIVVRKDGELVCYDFYDRNDVEDYLYNNTQFDRGSRSRYHYGSFFRGDDGAVYIRLNLQIRFTK